MSTSKDLETIRIIKNSKLYPIIKAYNYYKDNGFARALDKARGKDLKYYNVLNKKIIDFKDNEIYIISRKKDDCFELKQSDELKSILKERNLIPHFMYLVKDYNKNDMNNENTLSYFDFEYNFICKSYIFYKDPKDVEIKYGCLRVDSIKELIEKIDSIEGIKLYSNYTNNNNVSIRTGTFFSVDGKSFYSGGAERYLIDLNAILEKRNINMNIYQDANFPMFRKYKNINVIGVPFHDDSNDYELKSYKRNMAFVYEVFNKTQLTIYSPFYDCNPFKINPCIGISHGVAWDNQSNKWEDGFAFEVEKNNVIRGAQMCDKLVSVDTNTCNWFQTLDYNLGVGKFSYLPNYVDIKEFFPRQNYLEKRDKIVITYPRRLYGARGLYLLLNITEKIINNHKNVEIHFVGTGFDYDLDIIKKIMEKYPENIFCYSKEPTEMHKVYKNTDISVIPTIMSEGTSLSCLESMASGNIVIATRVGGLPNLIINNYNGYLIEPNEEALYNAIEDAINNYSDRSQMRKNAVAVAETFNKDYWNQKWEVIFNEFNLKESNNKKVELIEYHVSEIEKMPVTMKDKIIKDLRDNKIVYVIVEKDEDIDEIYKKYQGQRFQIINKMIDESFSPKHKIYYEKDFISDKRR